jgi:uncharacterized protein with HEPN domain
MPRDPRAYLADILEACDAVDAALAGIDLESYCTSRLVRSSVEREFTVIGEAVLSLSRRAPAVFAAITGARRIVDFRNQLVHEYPRIDNELVWAIAKRDLPVLRAECKGLLDRIEGGWQPG